VACVAVGYAGDGDVAAGDGAAGDGVGDAGDGVAGDGDSVDGDGDSDSGDGDSGDGDSGDGDSGDGDGDDVISEIEIDPICQGPYHILDRADRNVDFNDGDGNIEWCDRSNSGQVGPQWQGLGWYRFVGNAGVQLPEDPPELHSCGTEKPGWMLADHPTIEDGVVSRTTCFNWANDTCQWQANIEVVNCGLFYLYHLPDAPLCALRYCGID
jgi:hypothetical protein